MTTLPKAITATVITMLSIGLIEMALADAENDLYQFCTTKAYGWPAPWKIEYCLCEGGKTTFPIASKVVNYSVIAGGGMAAFAFIIGLSAIDKRLSQQNTT